MSEIIKERKSNKSLIVGVALITASVVAASYFAYSYLTTPKKVEGTITSLSENFDELAETGLLLVNQGSIDFNEVATELQNPQINFFENNSLSETSSIKPIYKLATNKDPEDVVEKFETIGLFLETVEEESVATEEGYSNKTYRNTSEDGYYYLRVAFNRQGNETMNWEYANDILMTETSWCPDIMRPFAEDYRNPGVAFEEIPLNIMELPESQIKELINLDAYSQEISEYESKCGTFESAIADERVFTDTVKEFMTLIGLNTENHTYQVELAEPNVNVFVYENIRGETIGPVAEFSMIYDGTSVGYAKGYYYELTEIGALETLSPVESIFRTNRDDRILGIIDENLYDKYNLINTTSPAPGDTYNLNNSEEIYVMSNTIDGFYALPGYILTDTAKNASIYVVSLPSSAFAPLR